MSAHPDVAEKLEQAARDAERFQYLQNCGHVKAQAYFWNYESRKQRAKAIDDDIAALLAAREKS